MTTPPEAPPLQAPPAPEPMLTLGLNPDVDPDSQRREQEAQSARAVAVQAAPFVWAGKPLAPFTPSRERAFQEHRAALNAPPWHEALTSANAFMADGARMLYFLAHDPMEWLNFLALQPRGEYRPDPARPGDEGHMQWHATNAHAALECEIQRWTDETFTSAIDERVTVYRLCQDIMSRAASTRPKLQDPADPDDSGNAHGLPSK